MSPQTIEPQRQSLIRSVRFLLGIVVVVALTLLLFVTMMQPVLTEFTIFVVDLQDGGGWDWTTGEPPKTHPAYYLRFCKSYSRMGGAMHYLQCDNATFVQRLWHELRAM